MFLRVTHVPHPLWNICVTDRVIRPEPGPDPVLFNLCQKIDREYDPVDISDTIRSTGRDIYRIVLINQNHNGLVWEDDK